MTAMDAMGRLDGIRSLVDEPILSEPITIKSS